VCTKWQFRTEYYFGGNLQMPKKTEKKWKTMVSQFPIKIIFCAELPFGTHHDSPYDDMEKF
jgi:hypothetical protein